MFYVNLNHLKNRIKIRKKNKIFYSDNNLRRLHFILDEYNENSIFLHIGLSDIKKTFNANNSYSFVVNILKNRFTNILAPGFTGNSFRNSRIYHKLFSVPVYGKFSELFFLNDANYRTNDCIHSILIHGDYNFKNCNHFDSFSENGCFAKLDEENILVANIGTEHLVSTQLHYIECVNKLPYVLFPEYSGVIYYDEKKFERVSQISYEYKKTKYIFGYSWNRKKIENLLIKEGVLKSYNINGLVLRLFKANDIRKVLEHEIIKNPYYLVS